MVASVRCVSGLLLPHALIAGLGKYETGRRLEADIPHSEMSTA